MNSSSELIRKKGTWRIFGLYFVLLSDLYTKSIMSYSGYRTIYMGGGEMRVREGLKSHWRAVTARRMQSSVQDTSVSRQNPRCSGVKLGLDESGSIALSPFPLRSGHINLAFSVMFILFLFSYQYITCGADTTRQLMERCKRNERKSEKKNRDDENFRTFHCSYSKSNQKYIFHGVSSESTDMLFWHFAHESKV